MGTLYEQILEDVEAISAELGGSENTPPVFTWNGTDYECVPSTANHNKTVDVGGFSLMADLILSVRTDLFDNGVYPEEQKSKITYKSKVYRVITIGYVNHGAVIRLHCVHEFRMA